MSLRTVRGRSSGLDRMERQMLKADWPAAKKTAHALLGVQALTDAHRARCQEVLAEVCSREKHREDNYRDPRRYVACLQRSAAHWAEAHRLRPTPKNAAEWCTHLWPFGDYQLQYELIKEAVAREPDNALYRTQLAESLLVLGRWREGFAEYEHRLEIPGFKANVGLHDGPNPAPTWNGADLAGKSILVLQEGGFGDVIQMARFLPWLREWKHAQRIITQTHVGLVKLMETVAGVDQAVEQPHVPPADLHVSFMSLPHRFSVTCEEGGLCFPQPYIKPTRIPWMPFWEASALPARPDDRPMRVGLVWHGNVQNPGDAVRSILPGYKPNFYPELRNLVLSFPQVEWVSLQLGDPATIVSRLPWGERLQWPALVPDWTVARDVIAELDLVIGVETAACHLSAAMGVPTWLLLAKSTAWRWLATGDTTCWYPSVRIFRQTKLWDWAAPLRRVQAELTRLMA